MTKDQAESRNYEASQISAAERYAAEQANKFVCERWETVNLNDVYHVYARAMRVFESGR